MQTTNTITMGYHELVAVVWTINRMVEGDPDLMRHNTEAVKAAMDTGAYIDGAATIDVPLSVMENISIAVTTLYDAAENSVVASYRKRLLEAWRWVMCPAIR